jgi:hypothetical protein
MSTTTRERRGPAVIRARRAWRRVEVKMSGELFERLEKWRRAVRDRDDDPTNLVEIDRTEAIERLIEAGIDRVDQSIDAGAAARLSREIGAIHTTIDAVGRDLRERMDIVLALLDRVGPATIAVSMILARWMSQDRDARGLRESAEQAEERILDEIDGVANAIWASHRREILPSEQDLSLPAATDDDPDDQTSDADSAPRVGEA